MFCILSHSCASLLVCEERANECFEIASAGLFNCNSITRSVLKVNEFTLAGAMRRAWFQEPLSGQKKRRGALLLLARKCDIFKKNTTTRDGAPHATIPSGYSTPRIQYTRGLHGRLRVIVLFSLQKLSKFQIEDKSKTQRVHPLSCTIPAFSRNKKRRGVECIYLSEAFDCPQRINANNSRPKRPQSNI